SPEIPDGSIPRLSPLSCLTCAFRMLTLSDKRAKTRGEQQRGMMTDSAVSRFEPIRAPSAYEMVAEAIEREIASGRLKPGDEIGTEAALVRQFGVNRSTVR